MYFVLGPRQFVNALTIGAIYALVALGYTMVYGIIELINFAHGDVFMVGAFVSLFVLTNVLGQTGSATSLAQIVFVLASTSSSTMIDRWACSASRSSGSPTGPLRNAPRLAPLITAIGVSFILQNIVQIIYGPSPVNTPQIIPPTARVEIGGISIGWVNIFIIVTAARAHDRPADLRRPGPRWAERCGRRRPDREAAQLMGVDINRTIAVTFLIGSALAGAAGVVQGLYFGNIQFTLGFQSGLKAFTAAVLGGIGNMTGAAIGGFIIGFVEVTCANFGFFVWAQAAVFAGPDRDTRLPPGRPARPAARRAGMSATTVPAQGRGQGARPAPADVRLRRSPPLDERADRRRPRRGGAAGHRPAAAVQRLQRPERLDGRLHQRRRLHPAGARPEHRGRPVRPARPRLRGLLRDRRVHLRLRRVAVLQQLVPVLADAAGRRGDRRPLRDHARGADAAPARRLPGDRHPRLRRDRADHDPEPRATTPMARTASAASTPRRSAGSTSRRPAIPGRTT